MPPHENPPRHHNLGFRQDWDISTPTPPASLSTSPRGGKRRDIFLADRIALSLINWWNLLLYYLSHLVYLLLILIVAQLWNYVEEKQINLKGLAVSSLETGSRLFDKNILLTLSALAVFFLLRKRSGKSVYLVDFACFQPPKEWRVTHDDVIELMRRNNVFTDDSLKFMKRILDTSATGQATSLPLSITRPLREPEKKSDSSVEAARYEAKVVLCGAFEALLQKTGLKPKDVDILIINCSLFSPTPSLCAIVAAHFNMRPELKTYNLSGMGCSAGVIAIDLAKQLLAANPNSNAVVNTLFRVGGAAILLSSRWQDGFRAKYKLLHTVRVQRTEDESYNCVYETEDEGGRRGIRLSKDIVNVAGRSLEANLTLLGSLVLPVSEQAKVIGNQGLRIALKFLYKFLERRNSSWASSLPKVKLYIPDFKKGIDHFCIHAGGRAVIDGIEKNLNLSPQHTEASRATLYNYGNTSSSSIWYELDYIERFQDMKRKDRVVQLAFGSGFKCNSAVWERLR